MASRDLTQGSIPKHILAMSMPVAGAMVLQSTYALIDLAFVRSLGEQAVAGLSISFQAFFLVLALSQAVATTALAELSQQYGAGNFDRARQLFSAFTLVGCGVGAASGLAAWLSADIYVAQFTADPTVHMLGVEYFQISAISFLLQLLLIVFGSGMRASGDFASPMKIMVVSVSLNLALDPLLIFGWGPVPSLGLAGAAWSTVISQLTGCIAYCWRFSRTRAGRELYWLPPAWSRGFAGKILTHGLPSGFQFFLISAVVGGILAAMKPFGPQWTATAGGGFRVLQQTFLPIVAIGSAAAAAAGQNLGAGDKDRVKQAASTAIRWALGYGIAMSVALGLYGRVAGLVFAATPADLDLAQLYFWWSCPSTAAFALVYVPTAVLQASGRALQPMLGAVFRVCLLYAFVFVYFPTSGLSPDWVFGAQSISSVLEGAVGVTLLYRHLKR